MGGWWETQESKRAERTERPSILRPGYTLAMNRFDLMARIYTLNKAISLLIAFTDNAMAAVM